MPDVSFLPGTKNALTCLRGGHSRDAYPALAVATPLACVVDERPGRCVVWTTDAVTASVDF